MIQLILSHKEVISEKLLISAVLSSALLISGSLSAKTLKFQISSKAEIGLIHI